MKRVRLNTLMFIVAIAALASVVLTRIPRAALLEARAARLAELWQPASGIPLKMSEMKKTNAESTELFKTASRGVKAAIGPREPIATGLDGQPMPKLRDRDNP